MFAIPEQIIILRRMKGVILLIGCVAVLFFGACSVTEQSASELGTQFQEGIQGRGQIVPNDPTNDSFGPEYR